MLKLFFFFAADFDSAVDLELQEMLDQMIKEGVFDWASLGTLGWQDPRTSASSSWSLLTTNQSESVWEARADASRCSVMSSLYSGDQDR
jgi:hypothetical protein